MFIEEPIENWIKNDRSHGDQVTDNEEDHDNLGIGKRGLEEVFADTKDVNW